MVCFFSSSCLFFLYSI
uniref:Uncharacterized protein n=1 Tax=Anopheles quadriannulatus TaxID=34691 RepID=A0A182XR31_ANOQN